MSRSSRLFLPATLALLSISFTACVGTVYDRMYSNKKTYFKAPVEREKSEISAEAILGQVDATTPAASGMEGAAPAGLPPAGGEIPGLPPAPAADGAAPMAPPPVPPPPAN